MDSETYEWWKTTAESCDASVNWLQSEAAEMAEAVNGGKWDNDYTEAQKRGWGLSVAWAIKEYLD